ncbi:trehalose synthase-fused probable maltokinase [Georgenia satyanarayanai]|uniref:Maltokinase n=1 Tax=Georgenia satyanarayanai TaxID=860221 RepID=A0A2Y9A6H5_9MICO|nr:aminoglycoside phosphotransferase [Georgenia satyanarayanai]PYG00486.1 trehalose synthase-fused probable maltokinase [Georgenia satyanarayanai]SSA39875.1 trehalose synthase-fused probable maltokinase [Georgenia satyanarayanai]
MPTLTPSFADFLPEWVARQRWYTAKGRTPQLQRVGGLRYQDPEGEVGVETWLVQDDGGPAPVVYQIPLTYRGAPEPELAHALVAQAEHSELGPRWIYDGCHDPVYARLLLSTILGGETVESDGGAQYGRAAGHRAGGDGAMTAHTAGEQVRVLRGEQSNTSIIFEGEDGPPVICKVFRVLADGRNPDVVVQEALAAAGSTRVPAPLGDLYGEWPGAGDQRRHGHLAFAQEFLPGVEDAWRVAVRAAADGADLTERATHLGSAVASVHRDLAAAFPTHEATAPVRSQLRATWRHRATAALLEVPGLEEHRETIAAVYARTENTTWPGLQRIHGDLHLGQVIEAPGRGWLLLDFEGEPLRPLGERTAPDLALRDVAGILRSLDYAAGAALREHGAEVADDWVARARGAFLDGYAREAGRDPREDAELLAALELDKALYEAVYEVRNRPEWLSIPVSGVRRLLGVTAP